MKIVVTAKFLAPGNAVPAIIEINGVRFFSSAPISRDQEDTINSAMVREAHSLDKDGLDQR